MSKFRNGSLIAIGMVMMAVALVAAGSRGAGAQSASSVSEVRDVDNPARQPFQRELNFTVAAGKAFERSSFVVAEAKKRLVIEHASAFIDLPGGQRVVNISIETTLSGLTANHILVAFAQGTVNGFDGFSASQQTRLYADPGTLVSAVVARNSISGNAPVAATISGYFVDIP